MDAFVSRDKLERRNTQDRGVSSSIIVLHFHLSRVPGSV